MLAGFAFGFGMMLGLAGGVAAVVAVWCALEKFFDRKG